MLGSWKGFVTGVGLALALTGCGQTGTPRALPAPTVDLDAPTETLAVRAATLRSEAEQRRQGAEARFEAETKQCYTRFFVNGCIADAKEVRLVEVRAARVTESTAAALEREVRRRRFEEKTQVKPAQ